MYLLGLWGKGFIYVVHPKQFKAQGRETGSQTGLTSSPYRIYWLGISCISTNMKIFHFENNLVLTGYDRRLAARDPSPMSDFPTQGFDLGINNNFRTKLVNEPL